MENLEFKRVIRDCAYNDKLAAAKASGQKARYLCDYWVLVDGVHVATFELGVKGKLGYILHDTKGEEIADPTQPQTKQRFKAARRPQFGEVFAKAMERGLVDLQPVESADTAPRRRGESENIGKSPKTSQASTSAKEQDPAQQVSPLLNEAGPKLVVGLEAIGEAIRGLMPGKKGDKVAAKVQSSVNELRASLPVPSNQQGATAHH